MATKVMARWISWVCGMLLATGWGGESVQLEEEVMAMLSDRSLMMLFMLGQVRWSWWVEVEEPPIVLNRLSCKFKCTKRLWKLVWSSKIDKGFSISKLSIVYFPNIQHSKNTSKNKVYLNNLITWKQCFLLSAALNCWQWVVLRSSPEIWLTLPTCGWLRVDIDDNVEFFVEATLSHSPLLIR